MKSKKACIVDDEEDLRELLSEFIEAEGYKTSCFSTFEEAMEKLACDPECDLIIADKTVGKGMNGVTCAEKLSQQGLNIPFLLMTGDPPSNLHDRPKGVDMILAKPLSFEEIKAAVKNLLSDEQ